MLDLGNISAGTWFVCVDLQFGLLFAVMLGIVQLLSRGHSEASDSGKTNAFDLLWTFLPLGLAAMFWLNFDIDVSTRGQSTIFHMPLLGAMAWWALEGRIPRRAFWGYAVAMAVGVACDGTTPSPSGRRQPPARP